jgi:hypothetical protein
MTFSADHGVRENDRIYVYFCGEKSVSKAAMKA